MGIFTAIFLIQNFCLHSLVLFSKSCPKINQLQSAGKESLLAWYYIVICAMHCVSFSSKSINVFSKQILKLKARNSSKKIVFSRVKNYFCNIVCKFLVKFQTMWRHEIKEKTPQLTSLYCCRIVRSSNLRFSIKNVS